MHWVEINGQLQSEEKFTVIHLTSGWMTYIVELNVLTKGTVANLTGTLFDLMMCFEVISENVRHYYWHNISW